LVAVVQVVLAMAVVEVPAHCFIQQRSILQIHVQSQLVQEVLATTLAQMQHRMEQFQITMVEQLRSVL
jgi:hypothetical protein